MQTNLKSDNFCGYNQEASPFYWILMPGQYENTFTIGEVGVPSGGGMAGSYIRPDVIDVSSFLSGRDNVLSNCTPPTPSLDSLNNPLSSIQSVKPGKWPQTSGPLNTLPPGSTWPQNANAPMTPQPNTDSLLPKYTKELRSSNSLDAIDYNRWQPNLPVDPQNLRYVIEGFVDQRGGQDTRNYVKSSWSNQNNDPNFDKNLCRTVLDPARACGPYCSEVNGYPGTNPLTLQTGEITYLEPGRPQPNYPFKDITSQQISAVGAGNCGPQFFSGPNYDQGSCPSVTQRVLLKH